MSHELNTPIYVLFRKFFILSLQFFKIFLSQYIKSLHREGDSETIIGCRNATRVLMSSIGIEVDLELDALIEKSDFTLSIV
jgi:hypothetical protein